VPLEFTGGGAVPAGGGQLATGQVQGFGWRMVRGGVGLAYLGFKLYLWAVFFALVAIGVVALGVYLSALPNGPPSPAAVSACWIGAAVLGICGLLLAGIGGLLGLLGQLLCCFVPQGVASRLCIWGSVFLMLVSPVVGGVGSFAAGPPPEGKPGTVTGARGDIPPLPPDQAGGDDLMQKVTQQLAPLLPYLIAGSVSLSAAGGGNLVSWLLWVCFLRQVGCLLGERRVARGVIRYVIYLVVWPLLMTCAGGLTLLVVWLAPQVSTPATQPWLAGVPAALFFLLLLVSVLWYFLLLRRTALTLRQEVVTA
jgi:hypothetical protein